MRGKPEAPAEEVDKFNETLKRMLESPPKPHEKDSSGDNGENRDTNENPHVRRRR